MSATETRNGMITATEIRRGFAAWSSDELAHRIAMETINVAAPMSHFHATVHHGMRDLDMWGELEMRVGREEAWKMINWHREDYIKLQAA